MNIKRHKEWATKLSLVICPLAFSAALVSCDDYLDVVPTNDIATIESTFEKRADADQWLQTCYVFMTIYSAEEVHDPAFFGADEFCAGDYARKNWPDQTEAFRIGDGLQGSNSPLCNVWHKNRYYAAIRYCNIFLDNIMNVYNMEEAEKVLWRAEVQAVKAYYYFDLMRRYGPIVLVNENIPANSTMDDMKQARRPITEVVDTIVSLCDQAMQALPLRAYKSQERQCYFSMESAATLKALTLLYAASPLFNGAREFQDFTNRDGEKLFPTYDKERWHRAAVAADEAIQICMAGGLWMNQGAADRPTSILNTIEDIEHSWMGYQILGNPEYILVVKNGGGDAYYDGLPDRDDFLIPYVSAQFSDLCTHRNGNVGTPMSMVEMFYTDHGLPLNEDKAWMANKYALSKESDERYRNVVPLNENILSLHRHREPRFYAMVGADRTCSYRMVGYSDGTPRYDGLLYQNRRGEWAGSVARRIDESTPQCLTGYWVKKYQEYTEQLYWYYPREAKRVMMRVPELLLASAEAWNEYLDEPDDRVYQPINLVRARAGLMPLLDAWTSYAKNPDKARTQSGLREIIHQEWNIEFAYESRRFWNVRRWMTAANELNTPQYGWNILATDEDGFYCNYEGPKKVWDRRNFVAPRDYFFPIRAEEILVSGVKQNPGW